MSKKCKVCWQPRDHDNPLVSRCKKCQYEHSNNNKKQTRINLVSKTNKNTPARFSKEVKAQILLRDKHCIFCDNAIQDYHHVFYWWKAEHWPDRNNVNKWVWLCRTDHERIHHFSDWTSQELRERCIEYLKQFNL